MSPFWVLEYSVVLLSDRLALQMTKRFQIINIIVIINKDLLAHVKVAHLPVFVIVFTL